MANPGCILAIGTLSFAPLSPPAVTSACQNSGNFKRSGRILVPPLRQYPPRAGIAQGTGANCLRLGVRIGIGSSGHGRGSVGP